MRALQHYVQCAEFVGKLGERLEQDLIAIPIGGHGTMASRFERRGTTTRPHALRNHRCLNSHNPTDFSVYRWEFGKDGQPVEVALDGALIVNDAALAVRCAIDGVGIVCSSIKPRQGSPGANSRASATGPRHFRVSIPTIRAAGCFHQRCSRSSISSVRQLQI